MEEKLKEALKTSKLKRTGAGGQGCISSGDVYETDNGLVYIKKNTNTKARVMFDGEFESLKAILSTHTVRVPEPYAVVDNPTGGALIAMEYVKMNSLSKYSEQLGQQLARLHKHNEELQKRQASNSINLRSHSADEGMDYVSEFGFHITTCCGYIPQNNKWKSDWVEFYAQHLEYQLKLVEENYHDREIIELWSQLQLKLPNFFKGLTIVPSLLHGDLWSGNAAETETGPLIFDPATFYGHAEYDLSIAELFGGFSRSFYAAYHREIPKAPGYDMRSDLYRLFHYINHWNHFGGGYRSSSLSTMRRCLKY